MAEHPDLKNIKISQEDIIEATQQWKDEMLKKGFSAQNIQYSIENQMEEVKKELLKKAKAVALDKYFEKSIDKFGTELSNQVKDIKKQNLHQRFFNWLNTTPVQGKDETAMRIRAQSAQRGIEEIIEGRFGRGLSNLAQTFPRLAHIMGGPYYLAIQTVILGLEKFDNALAKATTTAVSLSGGLRSDLINQGYFNRGGKSLTFLSDIKSSLYNIGMQNEFDNLVKALTSGYGMASYTGQQKNFIETMGYAQKGLSSYGISGEASNSLVSNLRLLEGKSQTGVYAQLQRLTDRFSLSKMFSPEQMLQQATSLYDQTKNLGTNFEWASKTILRFEKALKQGTMSLSDFAAMNRALQSGGVQKNAGISALLIDYASKSGINLPQSFLNSNIIGQGFALSSPKMLGNNNVARAMGGKITEMLDQMGLFTEYERAGGLQHILSNMFGINISAKAALESLDKSGNVNLLKSGVAGSRAIETQLKEQSQAEQYEKDTRLYYTASTSWHQGVLDALGIIANNTKGSFGRGLSGEVSTNGFNLTEFAGVATQALFTQEYWQNVGNTLAKAIPVLGSVVIVKDILNPKQ